MPALPSSFLTRVWRITAPYWKSEERWMARGLLAVVIALNLGEVYLSVLFNEWNNGFYNSLQEKDKAAFYAAIIRFSYLAAMFIAVAVYRTYLNQMLRIKWRRWLTQHYLSEWLHWQNYYRMQLFGTNNGTGTDNPDQRISEDIEQFIQLALTLSLGLLSSVVTLFSFLAILWGLSGPLDFNVSGHAIHIPGYMVWAALGYAIVGTWITVKIGRPLVRLNFDQQRFEADFRFSMVRLRENSESIAFYRGEPVEQANFSARFHHVVGNFWQIMKRQKLLNWFASGYGQIAIIFPYVVAAPRYFAGSIQLGGMMQTASAFGQVQSALSYIIDSYTSIATWRAVVERLDGFNHSIARAGATAPAAGFARPETAESAVSANQLTLLLPDGSLLLKGVSLSIAPGDSLLVSGPSGIGKSTLLRALAGLWPFMEGTLTMPQSANLLFVPQKPYLPLGTLAQALCYPQAIADDALVQAALSQCGLAHLHPRLHEEGQWWQVLSLGEQQRVAFARILLNRPDFLFLDEATSALDEAAEAQLYGLIQRELPATALVSVGHRASLNRWHKTIITLGGNESGGVTPGTRI